MVKLYTASITSLAIKAWVNNTAVSPPCVVAVILCVLGLVVLHFWIRFYSHLFSGHLTACIFECLSWHRRGLYHLCRLLLLIHLLFLLQCVVDSFKNDLEHYQKNRRRCSWGFFFSCNFSSCFSTGVISKYLCVVGSWTELDRMSCWTFISCWTFCVLFTAGYCLLTLIFIYLLIFPTKQEFCSLQETVSFNLLFLQLFFHYSFTLCSRIVISYFKWVQPFNPRLKMAGYFCFHLCV